MILAASLDEHIILHYFNINVALFDICAPSVIYVVP